MRSKSANMADGRRIYCYHIDDAACWSLLTYLEKIFMILTVPCDIIKGFGFFCIETFEGRSS